MSASFPYQFTPEFLMTKVDLLISGGTVLPFCGAEETIFDGCIAVDGENIIAVGKREIVELEYTAKERINAHQRVILPGLINGHAHSAMTCFRGMADDLRLEDWLNNYIFPAEARNVNRELVYWGSLLACAEMIRSGTTTFCDMYIFENEVAQAARSAGMRCLVGEVLFDFPSPNSKTPDDALDYTRELVEKWHGDPLVNIIVEPHSLYTCSPDLLRNAKCLADRYGLHFGVHFLETRAELQILSTKFGQGPTNFLSETGCLDNRFIGFHGVHMSADDIRTFSEKGAKIVHNPESNMKLASGIAPVPEMIKSGLTVGIGTDGCASNNNLDLFQEMDMAAKIHKAFRLDPTVMDARTVLHMATSNGAEALGFGKVTGSLRPGLKADIIIVDFNKPHLTPVYNEFSHLVYAAKGSDVETSIINGRIVMRDRSLLTIDEEEVMARVREISSQIKESLHIPR